MPCRFLPAAECTRSNPWLESLSTGSAVTSRALAATYQMTAAGHRCSTRCTGLCDRLSTGRTPQNLAALRAPRTARLGTAAEALAAAPCKWQGTGRRAAVTCRLFLGRWHRPQDRTLQRCWRGRGRWPGCQQYGTADSEQVASRQHRCFSVCQQIASCTKQTRPALPEKPVKQTLVSGWGLTSHKTQNRSLWRRSQANLLTWYGKDKT